MNNLTKLAKETLENIGGFIDNNHYQIIKVDDYYCELEGFVDETSLNHLQIVHGGYLFGLADTAAGIAAMTNGKKAVTVNASINYLKASKGNRLVARAQAVKTGENISVFEVSIFDTNNELVSKATMTYFYINK